MERFGLEGTLEAISFQSSAGTFSTREPPTGPFHMDFWGMCLGFFSSGKFPWELFCAGFWKENIVSFFFPWKAAAQAAPSTPILYTTLVLREDLNKKCQGWGRKKKKNHRRVISHATRGIFSNPPQSCWVAVTQWVAVGYSYGERGTGWRNAAQKLM